MAGAPRAASVTRVPLVVLKTTVAPGASSAASTSDGDFRSQSPAPSYYRVHRYGSPPRCRRQPRRWMQQDRAGALPYEDRDSGTRPESVHHHDRRPLARRLPRLLLPGGVTGEHLTPISLSSRGLYVASTKYTVGVETTPVWPLREITL